MNRVSKFIGHQPCPNCGSRDNLGVWDDHTFCFGCRAYRDTASIIDRGIKFNRESVFGGVPSANTVFELPVGSNRFSDGSARWLAKYHVDHIERGLLNCYWAPREQWLVFPFMDKDDRPAAFSARNFSGEGPKYLSRGTKPVHVYKRRVNSPYLILAEDPVSSVRISSVIDSSPLLGATIDIRRIKLIKELGYNKLAFWLDLDKANEALRLSNKFKGYFDTIDVIVSKDDPKCYDTKEISKYCERFLR